MHDAYADNLLGWERREVAFDPNGGRTNVSACNTLLRAVFCVALIGACHIRLEARPARSLRARTGGAVRVLAHDSQQGTDHSQPPWHDRTPTPSRQWISRTSASRRSWPATNIAIQSSAGK